MVKVRCLGAAESVTGSCYLVETSSGNKILVDCGLFQGGKQMERRNWADWLFDPAEIEVLLLTHAHIDHCGRIPKLVKDGFKGKILASKPTIELCGIMLLDSAHVQEMDAEWQTRKNKRQARAQIQPLYITEDAEASLKLFSPIARDEIITVSEGIRARFRNAGHILGSCIIELWIEENSETIKIVFSGDLGRSDQLIIRDPHEVFDGDFVFLESTYGNRLHRSFDESKGELLSAIKYSVSKGEKIIIPAFAVERTQEIIYVLSEFHRQGLLPDIPVYLDSPLAIKATEIFRKNKRCFDEEALSIVENGHDPFDTPNLRFTPTTAESIAINERAGSAIIISANGMCTAGRIKHHLKHNLWREGASIVIIGFQARGTTGRQLVEGAKQVKIFGENVAVKAKVFTIGGFSAHADQADLVEWLSHFESNPKVFLVHGEPSACEALGNKIQQRFDTIVRIPKWKEQLIFKPREFESERAEEIEPLPDMKTLMFNTFIDVENEIKNLKKQAGSPEMEGKIGEDDVDRLKYILEELQMFFPPEKEAVQVKE
ncbi:MAG TPA: MBL fold metallo-hydrolase [Desulfobacteraceae bacterium]|nr:MBL fold metallo-hydrolase [Desulfobacteraceae bacterium]HPJ67238.1 MBL fold metallo-hydrolase [Desulfobacteraceae bacterium]HPQ27382.1 MBL fold metallo-hydrolase [Desulfobacteraceae bacterium]